MQAEDAERWRILCEKAVAEQDPQKMLEIVKQIIQLLDKKKDRLDQQHTN